MSTSDPDVPHVSEEHRRLLLAVADEAVRTALVEHRPNLPEPDTFPEGLREPGACFVTLRCGERLLGCIGSMEPRRPLVLDVAANAVAAAFDDPRMPAVTASDYREMEIKISVLTPLEPLDVRSLDELAAAVRPGIDGLLVTAGPARGTFLPSVWEQLPAVEEFLDHLWVKAGLQAGSWPEGIVVERYGTQEFGSSPPRHLG